MYWLAKGLFNNNVSVKVLTTDRGISSPIIKNVWLETDFGKCQYVNTWKNILPATLFIKSVFTLHKVNTLYLASFFYPLSFMIAPIGLLLGKQVIWGPRGETSSNALQFSSFKKRCILKFIRLIKNRVVFHATSIAEAEDIKNAIGICRIELIPVGMEVPVGIHHFNEHKHFLFLGRIHPIKGLENLFQALALSKHFKNSNHKLLIAGYGQKEFDIILKKLATSLEIEEKIDFIGRVEGEAKDKLIAGSFFLVLPSFSENFGAVVAESLSQGTPVIASKGTPWEILNETKSGIWVENDPKTLSNQIDNVLNIHPSSYLIMRRNARDLALEKLDVNNSIPQWINLLQSN